MPIELIFTIRDYRGKDSTTSVKIGTSETAERAELFGVAWADVLDNLIAGAIQSCFALLGVAINTLTGNVVQDVSDVEEVASVQSRTTLGYLTEMNIPAIDEDLVDNLTGELDQAAPAVAALITMLEDGIVVGVETFRPTDIGGDAIETVIYARERSRNSGTRKKA